MTEQTIYKVEGESDEFRTAVASAQATFKFFWRELSWERRRIVKGLDLAAVKMSFAVEPSDSLNPSVENMWVTDVDFDGEMISGVLMNEPRWVTSMSAGDPVSMPLSHLNDWVYVLCGRAFGGFTIDALRSSMSVSEREEHDKAWGLDFGEPGIVELVPSSSGQDPFFFTRSLEGPSDKIALAELELSEHPMSANVLDKVDEGLRQDPSLVSDHDDDGWQLLHREVLAGNYEFVIALLRHGADPLAPNSNGHTPLALARLAGWPRIIELLGGDASDYQGAAAQVGFPLWPIGLALVAVSLGGFYFLVMQPLLKVWSGTHVEVSDPLWFILFVEMLGLGLVACTGPWYFLLRLRTPLWGKSRAMDLIAMLTGLSLAFLIHDQLGRYLQGWN